MASERDQRDEMTFFSEVDRRRALALLGLTGLSFFASPVEAAPGATSGIGPANCGINPPACPTSAPPFASDLKDFPGIAKLMAVLAVHSVQARDYRRQFNVCPAAFLEFYGLTDGEIGVLANFDPNKAFVYVAMKLAAQYPSDDKMWAAYNQLTFTTQEFWNTWADYPEGDDTYDDPSDCIKPEDPAYGKPKTRIRKVEPNALGGGKFALTIRGEGIVKAFTVTLRDENNDTTPVTNLKLDDCSTFRCSKLLAEAELKPNVDYILGIDIAGTKIESPPFSV